MSEVDVNSGTLREAGGMLSDFHDEVLERNNTNLLHGTGDHMAISTGGFYPGALAQQYLSKHPPDAYKLLTELSGDLLALSSALHIVADVYETADHEQAMEFAFLNPEAGTPSGLPPDVRTEYTVGGAPKEGDGTPESLSTGGEVPEGGSVQHSYHDGSSTVTTVIRDADGKIVSRKLHTFTENGGYRTRYYDGEYHLLREEHKDVSSEGNTSYYTDVYDRNGNSERRDEMSFGSQPHPVAPGQPLNWMVQEQLDKIDGD